MFYNLLATMGPDLNPAVQPVWVFVCTVIPLVLSGVSVYGIFKCVSLGVAYSRSDENGSHEQAKKNLKNAIVGYVLIFVLTAVLWLVRKPMIEWLSSLTDDFSPNDIFVKTVYMRVYYYLQICSQKAFLFKNVITTSMLL